MRRPMVFALGWILLCWLAALAAVWWSAWFVGSRLGMVVHGIGWLAVLVATVTIALASGRRAVVVLAAAGGVALVLATYNWAAVAPRAWFELHRPLYERAARTTAVDDSYHGPSLPLALRPLAAGGSASTSGGGGLFFPQWIGIPDDGGGYFYSPDRSPEGADMFGTLCLDPVDLGDGWWMCGM